jgi:3-phenylpropionate/trans-cinnamate dioxygenase ferredoxin component
MEDGYKLLCKLSELIEKHGKRFIVDDVEVAVFKIDGEVFAIGNVCPHQHTALLYDGFVENGCVVCPAHGWIFDLRTGKQPSGSRGVDSYPVIIENDEVYILVKTKELKW